MKKENKYKTMIHSKLNDNKPSNKNKINNTIHKKRFSVMIDSSSPSRIKRFESLIKINDENIIHQSNEERHNTTFTLNPQIKKKLLKDYKLEKNKEKKYRKLKIIRNLSDSSQSSEESNDEDGKMRYNFYISSESYFILAYDIILLYFSIFSVIYIPLNIAEKKYYCKPEKTVYIVYQYIIELLFIFDLLISFFRSYYNFEYKEIISINQIIKHYLKSEFFLDFICAFPSFSVNRKLCKIKIKNSNDKFNLITDEILSSIFLVLKIFKIFKVLNQKRNKFIELIYEKVSDSLILEEIIDTITYSLKIFSFLHTLICIHIFIGEQHVPNWMTHVYIQNENLLNKYISSFYFIIETMTTVGYGDIVAISFIEILFQLVLLSTGIVSYSFIVTKFGNYIKKKNKEEIELEGKKLQLEQIRITYPLMPFKLYIKIQEYLTKKVNKKTNKQKEIKKLMDNLPDQLRNELLLIMNKNVIKNFLFFRNCKNTDFITKTISCFIQAIFKKETVLIKEGEQVENIIFVKDGRLILEATINLLKPYESYQKYFKENFKYLNKITNDNNENMLSELDKTNNNQEENMDYLKSKLNYVIGNLKLNFNNNYNFNVNRKSSNLFLISQDIDSEENNSDDNKEKEGEEGNFQYLKILDVRKNEHFGNICMFLEKPAPLTLIVKSKIAEIFSLRKKDAIMINNFHHNIMKKIYDKSYKNLLSIKKKTFQILKKYFDLNHYKRTIIEDKSWFQEKSKEVIMQDLTNFINNSVLKSEKNEIAATTINFHLKDILGDNKFSHRLSQMNNSYNMFNILNNMKNNNDNSSKDSKNFLSSKWIPKVRKSINIGRKSFISNLSPNYYPKIAINNSEEAYRKKSLFINNKSDNTNYINYKNEQKENTKNNDTSLKYLNIANNKDQAISSRSNILKKSTTKELSNNDLLESTIKEEMLTLNNLHDDFDEKLRKKIKTNTKRDKILKLSKIQNNLINSCQEEINSSLINDETNTNNKILNNFKKITELNNTLYSNLIEYLETDYESENDEKSNEKPPNQIKKKLIIYKSINFTIQSSYYNLNLLTNGKIINDESYKIDIKQLVEKYISTKKKFFLNLFKEYINFRANNKFNKEDTLKKNYTKNEMNITPHNEEMSQVYNSIITEKVKIKHPRRSKTKNNNKTTSNKLISNKIKKNKTNKKDIYRNFKNTDDNGKPSQLVVKNNYFKKRLKTINYEIEDDKQKNDENNDDDSSNIFGKMINKIFSRLKNK